MRSLIFLVISIGVFSCNQYKPQIYVDGKAAITFSHCVESHSKTEYGYHYGYNFMSGKFEYHLGMYQEDICDRYETDTVYLIPIVDGKDTTWKRPK